MAYTYMLLLLSALIKVLAEPTIVLQVVLILYHIGWVWTVSNQ